MATDKSFAKPRRDALVAERERGNEHAHDTIEERSRAYADAVVRPQTFQCGEGPGQRLLGATINTKRPGGERSPFYCAIEEDYDPIRENVKCLGITDNIMGFNRATLIDAKVMEGSKEGHENVRKDNAVKGEFLNCGDSDTESVENWAEDDSKREDVRMGDVSVNMCTQLRATIDGNKTERYSCKNARSREPDRIAYNSGHWEQTPHTRIEMDDDTTPTTDVATMKRSSFRMALPKVLFLSILTLNFVIILLS